jgi:hypothetical protein
VRFAVRSAATTDSGSNGGSICGAGARKGTIEMKMGFSGDERARLKKLNVSFSLEKSPCLRALFCQKAALKLAKEIKRCRFNQGRHEDPKYF